MKLSDPEKKLVTRLRKQQQLLIRMRWVGLLAAAISLAVAVFGMVVLGHFHLDNPAAPDILAVAILIPVIYVWLGIGAFLMVHVLWCWNGRPETRLLLRLIEELQDKDP
jgi:hypothetical protein